MEYNLTIYDEVALSVLIEYVKRKENNILEREIIMDDMLLRRKILDAAEWYEHVSPSELSDSPFHSHIWREYVNRLQVIKKESFFSGLPEDFRNYLLDYFGTNQ